MVDCSPKLIVFAWILCGQLLVGQEPGNALDSVFLFQPPAASARMELPRKMIRQEPGHPQNMGDAASTIEGALDRAGYSDQGWFLVGQRGSVSGTVVGFAVVTRLEQVDDQGVAVKGGARFAVGPASHPGSFLDAIKVALTGSPSGKFRVFMIWVQDGPVAQSANRINIEDFSDYLRKGTKAPVMGTLKRVPFYSFEQSGGFYAFVYEFERSAIDGQVRPVATGLTAPQHLRASGIWSSLQLSEGD